MNTRFTLTVFTIICISIFGTLSSQEFVSLNWNGPLTVFVDEEEIKTDIPGFEDAIISTENGIPYYCRLIELGREYDSYKYEVKIEYPEYQQLTKQEANALKQMNLELPDYPKAETELFVSSKKGMLDIRVFPFIYKNGNYYRINSFKLVVDKTSIPQYAKRVISFSPSITYAEQSVLSTGKWVKIRVGDTGVYEISHSELKNMGFSDPSKVRLYGYGGFILPEKLSASKMDDLPEIPLWREGNRVLFYANGTILWEMIDNKRPHLGYRHTQNHYSTHGYYFLTESEEAPLEFSTKKSLSSEGKITVTTYPDYALEEKEEYSWGEFGRKLYENLDYKTKQSNNYPFNLTGIISDSLNVEVAFATTGKETSSVAVYVNGNELGEFTINGYDNEYRYAQEGIKSFKYKGSQTEKTNILLKHNRTSNISGRLNYIRLNYTKKLALYNNYTRFRSHEGGKLEFLIENANINTIVWNVSDPTNYYEVQGNLSNNKYSVITNNGLGDEWVVLNQKASFLKPEIVGNVSNQNLHAIQNANMVIIVPSNNSLTAQAERLAEIHRKKDGLIVEVVTSEQIYNEFSSGTPDATAYRWFMKMLHDRSTNDANELKYLLLFGDASYDNRMLTNAWKKYNQKDFLLCYSSAESLVTSYSYTLEDYFGFLKEDETVTNDFFGSKLDIAVGRIPVRTELEAKQVVDKITDYIYNKNAGAWKNTICFLGDDGGEKDSLAPHQFMEQADKMAKIIEANNKGFLLKKVYWDAYPQEKTATGQRFPGVTKQLLEQFDEGMLLMNYTGHGSTSAFSHEYAFTNKDISLIKSSKPPLWITAACEVGPFDGVNESMGEMAFLHPKGAAIALYTTTRVTQGSSNNSLNNKFIEYLFLQEKQLTIGEAYKKSKLAVGGSVTKNMWVLLGDPALKLSIPTYNSVIDKVNGFTVGSDITIKAGEIITVEGRILNEEGKLVDDFDGIIYPTILDSKETIITYNHNYHNKKHKVSDPFVYEDQTKTIFKGSDSIRAGNFIFKFPVPLDINYSFEEGMMNLYAVNTTKEYEGQGIFTDFLIGGTGDGIGNDLNGPKIKLYLNTPDFRDGDKVNETPCLVAELDDEDGINAVGNGIGHDLIAIIDNSSTYTYVLNNYYESILGDYTRGTVRYSFDELPEGKHELLFRAWDIKNNSSTASLKFEVVKGLKPTLLDVDCANSPVRDQATFILTHDRPESEVDIILTVFDLSGNELWSYEEKGSVGDNYYYIDWDLKTRNGQKVRPGLYVFRASVASSGNKRSTKSKKIVILD